MQTETVPIESLNFDPNNVRVHGDRNIDAVRESLRRFGQQKPIVIGADATVIAGNGTLEAAIAEGWTHIDIVRSKLTGADAKAYAIADNRTAELASWDDETLAAQLEELRAESVDLMSATAFDESELDALIASLKPDEDDDEEPKLIEPPANPITKPGDVWQLGPHRLICGDCRDPATIDRLFDGASMQIAVSSPPYASQREYDESTEFKPVPPDEYVEWFKPVQANIAAHLAEDGCWFLNIKEHCEDGQRTLYVKDLTLAHVREWGWRFVDELIWKHGGTPKKPKRRFKNGWEPIFQFAKVHEFKFNPDAVRHESESVPIAGTLPGSSDYVSWQGQGKGALDGATVESGLAYPSNVLSVGLNRQAVGHSAAYPVELPLFFINAYTDEGEIVFDPFMGSGSTLIAAHKANRVGYGTEISPAYCDIIVQRCQDFTDETAEIEVK